MILYILAAIIVLLLAFKLMANTPIKDLNKYKFLFRNDILSSAKKETQAGDTIYQLAPVLRGKVYRPFYIYLPEQEQYLVCSNVEHFGFRRYDPYAPPHPTIVDSHVLLNKKGEVLHHFDTSLNLSVRSGMFFTDKFYINWLQSGDTTRLSYAGIYNSDVKMDAIQFADKFRELHAKANYFEFVNLRTQYDDNIGQGIVFKINNEWHILLDGVRDSHIYGQLLENDKTGVDTHRYSLKFDYKDSDRKLEDPYPQSEPLIKTTYLETNDTNPYHFNTWASHDGLKIVKYEKQSSTGWQGVAEIKGIPIFVPGTGEGIAFMTYKTPKGDIHFKIPDVTKYDYRSVYNLGVRAFKLPAEVKVDEPLVFIESTQNFAHYLRDGGGVYVIRPCLARDRKTSDLPNEITEERYNELPLSLQVALMDIHGTTQLKVGTWYPELLLLHNLSYLKITASLSALPDEIAALDKLEVLDLEGCGLESITPKIAELKHLKQLNLYSNRLTRFPLQICELKELTHLAIGGNDIHELPNTISKLNNLKKLNLLLLNDISLPETMVDMKKLRIERAGELKETLPAEFHFLFEKE